VIPPNMKGQYKQIKEASLVENKLVCQIAVESTLRKKNAQSIATKILLQIIAKRGNTLWVPKGKGKFEDLMLIGIDNCTLANGKNLMSACCTVNSTFTSIQTKNVEFKTIDDKFSATCSAVLDLVNAYVDRNKVPPKDIILFSNAVSGDQVKLLKEYLVDEFLKKAENIYKEKCPSLQVVMVNTKTSERFFTENSENVRAGTLINSEVVSNDYDFYLVSQNSNRGCIVPNHYKVIFNNSKLEEGMLAELVYGQCYNYVNWSGSIKVPGILQYAKKCAKFHSEVMEDQRLSSTLERCLYFV
jgi:aubergine-like protein